MATRIPVLVIGAGISGLSCAYALSKCGKDVRVVEASEHPGGVIRSERRDGFLFELGPQSFAGTATLQELCRELHLEAQLTQAPARAARYILVKGSLRSVPLSPPALIASFLLGVTTRWKMARDLFGKTSPPAEDESVGSFVRRKFGVQALDRLVGPFVSGVYAGDPERLSLRSAFPQLYEAEKSAGSVFRGLRRAAKERKGLRERPTLFSFRDGTATLVRALAEKLGSSLSLRTEAISVELRAEGQQKEFEITIQHGGQKQTIAAKQLIIATPAEIAGKLLRNLNPGFAELLCPIEYAPVAVISLGYRLEDVGHSLKGFGLLVPRSAGLRVLGTVWNSSLFPGRAPQGYVLLTSFFGGATDPEAAKLSPENLLALAHRETGPVLQISKPPVCSNVEIHRRALPQYSLGHGDRVARIEELRSEVPNLWLAGNYFCGPAIGACVEQAFKVARKVLDN